MYIKNGDCLGLNINVLLKFDHFAPNAFKTLTFERCSLGV